MAYKGGANLGQGLAGAFGVNIQDPTIQRATRLRQLASQYNTNTAKGLRDMAAALQATDPESAFQLTQRAMAMDEAAQKSRKEEAEITLKAEEIKTLNAEAKNDKLTKTLYSIGMFTFITVAGLLYFGFKQRMKKNKIEVIQGTGKVKPGKKVEVTAADGSVTSPLFP